MRQLTTTLFGTLLLAVAFAGAAQHAGQTAAPPTAGANACAEHAAQSLRIIDRINRQLEAARQSNNPARMRAAMDDLQGALAELKTYQSLSIGTTAKEPAEGSTSGSGQGEPLMDHSKMGHEGGSSPAKEATQPIRTATPAV